MKDDELIERNLGVSATDVDKAVVEIHKYISDNPHQEVPQEVSGLLDSIDPSSPILDKSYLYTHLQDQMDIGANLTNEPNGLMFDFDGNRLAETLKNSNTRNSFLSEEHYNSVRGSIRQGISEKANHPLHELYLTPKVANNSTNKNVQLDKIVLDMIMDGVGLDVESSHLIHDEVLNVFNLYDELDNGTLDFTSLDNREKKWLK